MRKLPITVLLALLCAPAYAQQKNSSTSSKHPKTENNIYTIKKLYLEKVLHSPVEQEEGEEDNDLSRFNRWFNMAEARTYPTGNLPRPDVLLNAVREVKQAAKSANKTTTTPPQWQSLGPTNVPSNYNGIGRVNCIVIDPVDTNTLFIGTACGGVWVSHSGGSNWYSNSDNFPSMSIADIAVNPKHRDTIYAATGDGYGYENGGYNIFWGGLYSAGVMKSTDTGHTWSTTGLSYLQSDNDMIQRLLIHPNKTGILLAATRNGLLRSTDAGATWTTVSTGHIFSMAFHATNPDTVYAINSFSLLVSHDAGATWVTLSSGINTTGDRCSIAVSPASPNSIWVLDAAENVLWSHDLGATFTPTATAPSIANFYGYYDRVLAVSPTDSNYILCFGKDMVKSTDGGSTWSILDVTHGVHVDNHAAAINPRHTSTIYTGNDGGIAVTRNGGFAWTNLADGLTISQIYKMSSSWQDPAKMLCGVQDNGSFYHDGTNWLQSNAPHGDGMDNAIHPLSDNEQITSFQYGNFFISHDQGGSYSAVGLPTGVAGTGAWVAPVAFNPRNADTIFFGMKKVYASYDGGASAVGLGAASVYFSAGAVYLAVAPSNPNIIYAGDYSRIMRTIDGGATWTTVSTGLPSSEAKTNIAVDPTDPMKIYATLSGYTSGIKVFKSTTGGAPWTPISTGIPNIPVNCIAVDSSVAGGLFIGTDMGVYYRDDANPTWTLYGAGLPNVIVDDIDINYTSYKIKVATYGRGVWEANLGKSPSTGIAQTTKTPGEISLYPNPAVNSWKVMFGKQKPASYSIRVMDIAGRVMHTQTNNEVIDASNLAKGVYNIEITAGSMHESIKAVKN